MLLQLPTPAPGTIENWLIPAVAILSVVALVKKVFWRKNQDHNPGQAEFVTKSEFHHELDAVRDKIDARFLNLSEKMDNVGHSIHNRLSQFEAGLPRVDERTKKP